MHDSGIGELEAGIDLGEIEGSVDGVSVIAEVVTLELARGNT